MGRQNLSKTQQEQNTAETICWAEGDLSNLELKQFVERMERVDGTGRWGWAVGVESLKNTAKSKTVHLSGEGVISQKHS